MIEDICKNMSGTLTDAFSSSILLQSELALKSLDSLAESLEKFACKLSSCIMENLTANISAQIPEIIDAILPVIELPTLKLESFNFFKNLNFQENYVKLSEEDCHSIDSILGPFNVSGNIPIKVTNQKMAVSDFIKSVLIPILAILLPMLLTIYYHKIDSIESQKCRMEELRQKEEALNTMKQQLQNDIEEKEILENILIELQNQSEYYKSLQLDPGCSSEVQALPAEALKPFVDSQNNDLSNLDASKNSKAATHKE